MKTKLLTLLAAGCLCFFSACSEDDSESLGDKCKSNNGVTKGCIVGTWSLKAIYTKGDSLNVALTDYQDSPGTLEIKGDGTYTYTTSNSPKSEMATSGCGGAVGYGLWEIIDATIKFKTPNGTVCFMGGTVSPTVDEYQMNFNRVLFQAGDNTDGNTKDNATEIFDRK